MCGESEKEMAPHRKPMMLLPEKKVERMLIDFHYTLLEGDVETRVPWLHIKPGTSLAHVYTHLCRLKLNWR